jgi:hypothetical protein
MSDVGLSGIWKDERGGRMRVIHEVPAPRELASMVRSFLYFHIYCGVSTRPGN